MKNLEQAFEALGEPAKAEKCPGIEGIKKEHDDFVANESPTSEVLDAFLTGAGHAPSTTRSLPTKAL